MADYSITQAQRDTLQGLIDSDNRVAFYLKLNEFTGSKSALLMAQISSSSSVIGGTAWAVNGAYALALPNYPVEGVGAFSKIIADRDMNSIKDRTLDGNYIVPNDQKMLLGAYNVWKSGLPNQSDLGYAFPGNGLIAYNYLAVGNTTDAAKHAAYAAATAPILASLSIGELFWESLDSSLNSGKSINEYLATNPGSQLVTY